MTPPPHQAKKVLLRVPLPAGWHIEAAVIDGKSVSLPHDGTLELTGIAHPLEVRLLVKAIGK